MEEYTMNQRAGKTHRAALGSDGRVDLRELIDFMERCSETLEKEGQSDASFYFGQIAEYIRSNPHKGLKDGVGRMLGL
jgi:hypothetical protein